MLKHLRHALLLLFALPLVTSAQTPQVANAFPVAYFSAKRAFAESGDGKAAQAKLASLREQRSREIDMRNLKLKELQRALEESGSFLDAVTRRQREREIERVETELQRMLEDAQAEVLDLQKQLETTFGAKLQPILASVAKDRGLLLVFDHDAGGIVWSAAALDITAEVVNRVNAGRD